MYFTKNMCVDKMYVNHIIWSYLPVVYYNMKKVNNNLYIPNINKLQIENYLLICIFDHPIFIVSKLEFVNFISSLGRWKRQ